MRPGGAAPAWKRNDTRMWSGAGENPCRMLCHAFDASLRVRLRVGLYESALEIARPSTVHSEPPSSGRSKSSQSRAPWGQTSAPESACASPDDVPLDPPLDDEAFASPDDDDDAPS